MLVNYFDTIDWSAAKTEPPLTKQFSLDNLWNIGNLYIKSNIYNSYIKLLPCHNQAVERCIRLISETSQKVAGHENREELIKTTIKCREIMPKFSSKKDYKIIP